MAYELLCGRPPFAGETLNKLVSMHLNEQPAPLTSCRQELRAWPALCAAVLKALEKDRARRFQDVKAFARALTEAIATRAGAVPAPAPAGGSAFEDWPPPEAAAAPPPPAAAPDDVWPPPEPAAGAAPDAWPPPDVPGTPAPAPAAAATADDFFAVAPGAPGPRAAAPAAAGKRLERELAAAQVTLEPERVKKLLARREGLKPGTLAGVAVHAEVLGPPADSPLRGRCLTRFVTLAALQGGVLDHLDEDGALFLFPGEDPFAAGGRALVAALAMREAALDERLNAGAGAVVSLRAAALAGKVEVPELDTPLGGELPAAARALAARAAPGQVVTDRMLAREVQDLFELRDASGVTAGAVELAERKPVLPTSAQRLLGRDAVLAQLDKRLGALAMGTVAPVLVTGGTGCGKSALSAELALRARHQSLVVGVARGLPSLRGQPYAALAELVCNVCGVSKHQRLTHLRPVLEGLKLGGADLEAVLVLAGVYQLPRPLTPGQAVHALRAVVAHGAAGRRVVLVFDGLEAQDRFSVDAFRELCLTPRSNELTVGFADASWARERLPGVPTVELEPLPRAELAAWLAALFPDGKPTERLTELLVARSRGNPGILLDWLHLLADRGLLRKRGDTWLLAGEPPPLTDAELAKERLEALGPHARRIVEAAAVAGDAVDSGLLGALVPDAPPLAFQRVVASRLLRALVGKRWVVASDRYREAALDGKSPSRGDLELRLAQALVERARAAGEQPDAATVALHLTRGGDGAHALPIWRRAAEQALARRAPRDAMLAFKGWADALALLSAEGRSADALKARLDALARAAGNALATDDPVQARVFVDEALAVAEQHALESAELQLMLARVLRSEARRARSAEALARAEQLASGGPVAGLCAFARGEAREAEGDPAGAAQAFHAALKVADTCAELARWYGDVDFRATVETRLAALLVQREPQAARKLLQGALARLRAARAPYHEARVLAMLGTAALHAKEPEDAARAFEEASGAAGRAGDQLFQARELVHFARALALNRYTSAAKQAADQARRLAASVGWAEGRREAEAVLGLLTSPVADARRT